MRASNNDQPNISNYVTIIYTLKNNVTETFYIYEDKGKTFLEAPYQGIYILDKNITIDNFED